MKISETIENVIEDYREYIKDLKQQIQGLLESNCNTFSQNRGTPLSEFSEITALRAENEDLKKRITDILDVVDMDPKSKG